MIVILDFDDVLFENTHGFKEHMFRVITDAVAGEEASDERRREIDQEVRRYYLTVNTKEFSLKRLISTFFVNCGLGGSTINEIYESIMVECPRFVNHELIERVKRFGRKNCHIVTNGQKEFNTDKLKYSEVWDLFDEDKIHIVPGTKKDAVEEICTKYPNTKIVFVDDKEVFIKQVKDIPRVTTIHYVSQSPEELQSEIQRIQEQQDLPATEIKRR